MNRKLYLLILICLSVLSCKVVNVSTLYSSQVDYRAYRSFSFYGWLGENTLLTESDKKILEQSFIDEFSRKGIKHEEFGGQLVLSLYVISDSLQPIENYKKRYAPNYNYNFLLGWDKGADITLYKTKEYKVGTLVCDVFRNNDKQIIWQAVRSETIIIDEKLRDEHIRVSVAELVEKYPLKY